MEIPTPLEQLLDIAAARRQVTIGLPTPQDPSDVRFPLTPEAAGLLVARGFCVKMQQGGASSIHYTDLRYQQQGVQIVDRAEAFRCDIVLYLPPLSGSEARCLRNGALLFTMLDSAVADPLVCRVLLGSHVISIALDLIADDEGHNPFADILAEVSGRAAIAIASSLLADPVHGKGILLGGIAGIVPCEVTILGSGIDACAAARSALGLGAIVRMFDNDIYRLRGAMRELGQGVSGSALHPHVLVGALHSADVVIATDIRPRHVITQDVVAEMKRGVVIFDLTTGGGVFPSLRYVEMGSQPTGADEEGARLCHTSPGNAVPRTAAMALSNTLLTMLTDISQCDGLTNALMLNEGLQQATLTFLGKAVNASVAAIAGVRHVDIKLILQFS